MAQRTPHYACHGYRGITLSLLLLLSSCASLNKTASTSTPIMDHSDESPVTVEIQPMPSAPPIIAQLAAPQTPTTFTAAMPINPILAELSTTEVEHSEALAKARYQRGWETISIRSSFVRQRIIDTLTKLHAPLSLQVIPVVESTYNPYAISYAGASGLWQLMPQTAQYLGVRSNNKTNGRRSIEQSSAAAISYLQQLHKQFSNWSLAFAAYNLGPYALKKRLAKQPWQPSDGLESLPIPTATRRYVQHIIGLIALLEHHQLSFPEPVQTRQIELNTPIDMHRLNTLSSLQENDLFRYNPSLNQAQYLNSSISIHVPALQYDQLIEQVQQAAPQYLLYRVKQGDSLWRIAHKHHITVTVLKELNQHIGKFIHANLQLKIPTSNLASHRAITLANPLLSNNQRLRYTIRSGDSLWRIAQRFGTTAKDIARYNGLSAKKLIRPGDTLWVLASNQNH
ncbi:MAG: LysM peptidoglycan-binding domain-containing protein [Mariprofundus sp.]|nr:LysM peptidoglycan-binding domain-containing protein [Mariprofundus sp.]